MQILNRPCRSLAMCACIIAAAGPAISAELEEVVVTAHKRGAENLQNTTLSAAVVSSESIEQRKLVGMDDYLRTIPGVNYQEYGVGRTTTIIRGVSADPQAGAETTGVYINEVPLTAMGDFGFSSPDVKLVDVNRVEVLRGPQGTLYGSSSMGGTVRVITESPRLDEFGGSISGTLSHTGGAGSRNSDLQGVLNMPLIPGELALRAVAYTFDNSGYFQNVAGSDPVKSASAAQTGALALDRGDVGSSRFDGGRVALHWAASDRLSIDLMYLQQETRQQGNPYGDLDIGAFRHARYSRASTGRSEFNENDLSLFNLLFEYDFGPVGMVSSSSWSDYETTEDWDVGQFWTFLYQNDAPIFILNESGAQSFAQEIRFDTRWDRPVNFVAGLYLEQRDPAAYQLVDWDGDPQSDPLGGALIAEAGYTGKYDQQAFFGELVWDVNDRLVATAGLRRYDYDIAFHNVGDGLAYGGFFEETTTSREDGLLYKVNLAWSANEQSLLYAQWSQGFNPGATVPEDVGSFCDADGDGLLDGLGLPQPDKLEPDSLDSYEIGSKVTLGDGRIALRAAAFYNAWTKIPILLVADCAIGFPFNAAEAMTTGFEVEGSAELARSGGSTSVPGTPGRSSRPTHPVSALMATACQERPSTRRRSDCSTVFLCAAAMPTRGQTSPRPAATSTTCRNKAWSWGITPPSTWRPAWNWATGTCRFLSTT